jgi:predicted TIM-barrel fold metal-dependent hydrolase
MHDHDAWLAGTVEEPLDPDLPICDPHHHLWDLPGSRYLLEDLHADTGSGHRVLRTVFVECHAEYRVDGAEAMRPVGETEFVARQAEASEMVDNATIAGIVSFADLTLGEAVEHVLAAHEAAGRGRFRGIRHASAWDASSKSRRMHTSPPPGLLALDSFRAGFAVLGRMGCRFDAWLYHPQLPELVDLARAFPDVTIVLDHLGAPLGTGPYAGRREEVRAAWRPMIVDLAACRNVVVKLGGIGMSRYGLGWERNERPPTSEELAAAWAPDIHWCIEHFGVERCMFESNFPVDKESTSYVVLWNTFKRLTAGASPPERAALFHDTATSVYGLS